MNIEQAKKVMRLHQAGYIVQVNSCYVDSFVTLIYEDEDGDIVFDSDVYDAADLTMFYTDQIKVSKPLTDWVNQPIG